MKNTRISVFEDYPIKKAVLIQVVPAIASQMITLIYSLADTYFVGLLNDPRQTAAVTVAFPSFLMLTAISNLFGIGGASAISRALGRNDSHAARCISAISIWCGLLAACCFSLLFARLKTPILYLCGASSETFPWAARYAQWVIVLGGPFTVMNTLLANLVRAEGGANYASIGVSFGGLLNLLLDPLLILPSFLELGTVGAGIATALSNMGATAFFLIYLLKNRTSTVLSPSFSRLRFTPQYLKTILSIGFPSAVQYALTVFAVSAQSKFISKYSDQAVAAFGIAKKLDQLPLYFSLGVANGLLPLLAYNHAAGNIQRKNSAFQLGCIISSSFSMLCVVLYEIFAEPLSTIFIKDSVTIAYSASFLRRMVIAMPLMALCYLIIIQFQAMERFKESLLCSILRKGVLDIPILFFMDRLVPLYGCMWVQPIVDSISLVVSSILCWRIYQTERLSPPPE